MIKNQLRFAKESLYHLKRDYGSRLDLYHITGETRDHTTGQKIVTKIKYTIKKAILLPTILSRELNLKNAAVRPTSEVAPQGFDVTERLIIIDNDDLPNDFEINLSDYVVIQHKRYDLANIQELEDNIGTLLTARHVRGSNPNEVYETTTRQSLIFEQVVDNE